MQKLLNFLNIILILFLAVACSNARLGQLAQPKVVVKNKGGFCTYSPEDVERSMKFIFVMDKSGSNDSTDPNTEKRANNIERFYNQHKSKSNFHWGLIAFQNPGTDTYIKDGQSYFTQKENLVVKAIDDLRNNTDQGDTPYGEALSLARTAIEQDINANPNGDPTYMIFFVSDGEPTDILNQAELNAAVKNITDLKAGSVFLSTAYYGPKNPTAEKRLGEMAKAGEGKYINFNNTDVLDFNDLIILPTKEPYQVKTILTYNLNASICLDGQIDTDSDGDGLCDRDELALGFNPQKRFSVAGGFGDLFRWREKKYREILPNCKDRSDADHDQLTKCEEDYLYIETPVGTKFKSGDPLNPDTDFDGILDGLEIFTFKDKSSALDGSNAVKSLDFEEDNVATQIAQHRNPLIWDPAVFKYDTKIFPESINSAGQVCYTFSQEKLKLYPTLPIQAEDNFESQVKKENENSVFIYFVQTPQKDPNGGGILMWSVQKLLHDRSYVEGWAEAAGLKVSNEIFKPYKVPKR